MVKQASVIVIGGGAAGLLAALRLRQAGLSVLLLEKNRELGKKVRITGGGRGNFCNINFTRENLQNLSITSHPRADKILRTMVENQSIEGLRAYFHDLGVPSQVEDLGRVFPVSQKASDLVEALESAYKKLGGTVVYEEEVVRIENNERFHLQTHKGNHYSSTMLLLACGGNTYPATGSTGDGAKLLEPLGIRHKPFSPAMQILNLQSNFSSSLQGIRVENVCFTYQIKLEKKPQTLTRMGDLLFMNKGLSGPLALSSTADLYDPNYIPNSLSINFLNGVEDFLESENPSRREVRTLLRQYLPQGLVDQLWPTFCIKQDIPHDLQFAHFSKANREALYGYLSQYTAEPGARPKQEAMSARGGIEKHAINFRTMALKAIPNLYVAGECIDFDFISGGYHLSFAYLSGALAADAIITQLRT